jgi:hypothetical protein
MGLAGGVGFGWGGLADDSAEIDEMFLGGGAFGEVGAGPFLDELVWGHREPIVMGFGGNVELDFFSGAGNVARYPSTYSERRERREAATAKLGMGGDDG